MMRLRCLTSRTTMRGRNKSPEHVQLCATPYHWMLKLLRHSVSSLVYLFLLQSSITCIAQVFCAIQMSLPIKFSI